MRSWRKLACLALALTVLSGCAGYRYTRRADEAKRADNWDSAVYHYLEALASDPGNPRCSKSLSPCTDCGRRPRIYHAADVGKS